MPYKHTELKIPKSKDKRIKLSDDDKRLIKELYKTGEYSQRKLAEQFNVSRRTIQFTINPDKRLENYQQRVQRGGSKQYYDKDKNNEYVKKHRHYKQELYINNKLVNGE